MLGYLSYEFWANCFLYFLNFFGIALWQPCWSYAASVHDYSFIHKHDNEQTTENLLHGTYIGILSSGVQCF